MENIGKVDRIVRGLLGAIMLVVFFQTLEFREVGLAGTLLLFTAVLAYCPVYALLGKSSIPAVNHSSKGQPVL